MTISSTSFYPLAPLDPSDHGTTLENGMKDVNTFNNSDNNKKETIGYFKDKRHKSKKNTELWLHY